MKAIALASLAAAFATSALAAPCPGVTVSNAPASPQEAAAVGRQISKGALPIDRKLQVGAWTVFHVDPKTAEPIWLFFKGDPAKTERIYLSPGLGRPDEYQDIKSEVEMNATGIPPALSACFAHLATGTGK